MWDALREIPSSELQPVVDYLLREKICCDELAARTKAREDYRCNGILRNRTFTPAQQHKKWEEATKKWEEVFNKAQSSNPKERCVIRKKTELVQGTLDQMKTMEACILKGCMEQPFDWQEMWLNTRIQPVTGLQERLSIGDTSRNEARHCALNQLVQNISHMNEDLMEVLLDFEIYFTNMRFDVLLGRVDAHSLTCFSWEVSELNSLAAASYLHGAPPFPIAATPQAGIRPLPPHKPVYPDDAMWEPQGFAYLKYLFEKRTNSQIAAAYQAGVCMHGCVCMP